MSKNLSSRHFTSKDAALTINYIGFVYRKLVSEGYASDVLLKGTDLSQENLVNPDYRCTFEQHKRFVLNAIAITGDHNLGPRMASRFNPINIGLPASAAMSSDIFSTALKVLQQFVSLNFSILSFDFYKEDTNLIIRWQPAVDVRDIEYFVVGSSLVITDNFWKLLLNEERVTECAELAFPEPDGWHSFSQNINFPIRFNAPFNKMVLPNRFLEKPLAGTDPLVHQNMIRLCEKQMAESYFGEGLEAQVRNLITKHHYFAVPIERVAIELGLSERSLRRQLSQSNTSYKKIVDDLRSARASELLAVSGLPITAIAYELGFSDSSNFARTFKRWRGCPPQEFRENLTLGNIDP